jgi:hypothetical protein
VASFHPLGMKEIAQERCAVCLNIQSRVLGREGRDSERD